MNGTNIKEYNKTECYKLFSAVFLGFCLLPGSVYMNAYQASGECGMQFEGNCVKKSGLDEKADTSIVLDKSTKEFALMDEECMYNKYSQMAYGKSSVYISHSLASARFCDSIMLVTDAGILDNRANSETVKNSGKHAELFEPKASIIRVI